MRRAITVAVTSRMAAALAAAVSILAVSRPGYAAVGLHVDGTDILEADGQPFVMRGVNHPHVWFPNQTASLASIKALGANSVRVVLGSGQRWGPSTDVGNVVALCKQNRLICVLEVHDTTGYGEEGTAASLEEAVSYWISQKGALVGEESYVVVNIGNEPVGNDDARRWISATAAAIREMRSNGFEHLLMVDAPNWGQDWQFIMRDNAQAILEADSRHNTVLSIHMYAVFNTAARIIDYLDRFEANGWPLVVGEFGWHADASAVDHETILAEAQSRGIGYLGWSWSGNSDPILDMTVDFDATQLTAWGQRIFNGPNGIKATAEEAAAYGGETTLPGRPIASCSTGTHSILGHQKTSSGARAPLCQLVSAGWSLREGVPRCTR